MSGHTNLSAVLKSIKVFCDNVEYGFATTKQPIEFGDQILGTFQEEEGLTIIASKQYLEDKGLKYEGSYAKLTIEAHTSLELVGLTAVLAKRLADHKISANVVAGFFHDHIFVQYDVRQSAIDAINSLKED